MANGPVLQIIAQSLVHPFTLVPVLLRSPVVTTLRNVTVHEPQQCQRSLCVMRPTGGLQAMWRKNNWLSFFVAYGHFTAQSNSMSESVSPMNEPHCGSLIDTHRRYEAIDLHSMPLGRYSNKNWSKMFLYMLLDYTYHHVTAANGYGPSLKGNSSALCLRNSWVSDYLDQKKCVEPAQWWHLWGGPVTFISDGEYLTVL